MAYNKIICDECNKEFLPFSGNQKRCSIKCIKSNWEKYIKNYKKLNKEKLNENNREYDKKKKKEVTYYLKMKQKHQNWQEKNREKIAIYGKKYKHTLKGRASQQKSRRTRRGKKVKHLFSVKEWLFKKERTKGVCPFCNKFVGINNITLDHIIPISKVVNNFEYTIDMVQPMCFSCNTRKHNLTQEEFYLKYLNIDGGVKIW